MDQSDLMERKRKKLSDRSDGYNRYHDDNSGRYGYGNRDRQRRGDHDSRRPDKFFNKHKALHESFKSFKQFVEINWDGPPPLSKAEQEKKYEEYKHEYNMNNSRNFFDQHKDEEWFKEKYDPSRIKVWYPIKVENAKKEAESFITDFISGNIAINFSADENENLVPDANKSQENEIKTDNVDTIDDQNELSDQNEISQVSNNESEKVDSTDMKTEDEENMKARDDKEKSLQEFNEEGIKEEDISSTLFVKTISPNCSRQVLYDTLSKVESGTVIKLLISDPNPNKSWHRIGWVTYSNVDSAKEALKNLSGTKMDGFELNLIPHKEKPGDKKIKITPSIGSQPDRITHDIAQAKALIKRMDAEKGIENNVILEDTNNLNDEQKLDILMYYLRKVHCFCYYSTEEFDTYDNMVMKCGEIYLRGTEKFHSNLDPNSWTQNLDSKIKWRLENEVTLDSLTGITLSEKFEDDFYNSHTNKVSDEDFRCTLCPKKFYAVEYIRKHLKVKHPELWDNYDSKLMEEQYFQNYLNDQKRITPSSVAIQSMMQSGSLNAHTNRHKRDDRGSNRRSRPGYPKGRGNWSQRSGFEYVDLDEAPKDNIEIDYSSKLAKFREKRKREKE